MHIQPPMLQPSTPFWCYMCIACYFGFFWIIPCLSLNWLIMKFSRPIDMFATILIITNFSTRLAQNIYDEYDCHHCYTSKWNKTKQQFYASFLLLCVFFFGFCLFYHFDFRATFMIHYLDPIHLSHSHAHWKCVLYLRRYVTSIGKCWKRRKKN